MRCQKCGYISFDHLSECRSCGVDLKAVRDGLGLLPVEPAIPLFLERLLKGYEEDISMDGGGVGVAAKESMDGTLPSIEFNETFELDTIELFPDSKEAPAAAAPPPAQEEMKEQLGSALKVFEEIEGLDHSSPPTAKPSEPEPAIDEDFEIDFVLDEDFSLNEAPKVEKAPAPEPAKEELSMEIPELSLEEPQMEELTIVDETASNKPNVEVSDQELEQIILDPDLEGDLDLELEFDEPAVEPPAEATAQQVKTVGKEVESSDENLVLELSEDDLESLILELDEEESGK